MTPEEADPHLRRAMRDTEKLYVESAKWLLSHHRPLLVDNGATFVELMRDLHMGALVKIYADVIRADHRWSMMEKFAGSLLLEHLWDQKLTGAALREAAEGLVAKADSLSWKTLVRPFVAYSPLHDRIAQVESVFMRMAKLIANCDGLEKPEEIDVLHRLRREIVDALGKDSQEPRQALPLQYPVSASSGGPAFNRPQDGFGGDSSEVSKRPWVSLPVPETALKGDGKQTEVVRGESRSDCKEGQNELSEDRSQTLANALGELDQLIGLKQVKERVRSLTNYLNLQKKRELAGLPTMPTSLHMAFVGNPGTGKTTVARIVGQILRALGILQRGHLVETDRSGLVAEYAGQSAPKTHRLVDSAVDGVLFIDEAYSLVHADSEDPYGREAVGALLKRMEDQRERLVVILAGYPNEMEEMIRSNPGLSSRINTSLRFEDYVPTELGQIFDLLCEKNHYRLPAESRYRLLMGFDEVHRRRDRHFGNGRLVRNAFEQSVHRLADRLAELSPLDPETLTVLHPADIEIPGLSLKQLDAVLQVPHTLRVRCVGCQKQLRIEGGILGRLLRCPKCDVQFTTNWAEVERT